MLFSCITCRNIELRLRCKVAKAIQSSHLNNGVPGTVLVGRTCFVEGSLTCSSVMLPVFRIVRRTKQDAKPRHLYRLEDMMRRLGCSSGTESWWKGFQSEPSRYQLNRVPRLPSAALKYSPGASRANCCDHCSQHVAMEFNQEAHSLHHLS